MKPYSDLWQRCTANTRTDKVIYCRLFDEHLGQGLKEVWMMFREIKTAEIHIQRAEIQREGEGEGGSHTDPALVFICRTNHDHQSSRSPGRHRGGEHRAALSGVSWPHTRAEVHLVLQRAAHPLWKPLGLFWESWRGKWSHEITGPSKKRDTQRQSSVKWGFFFSI